MRPLAALERFLERLFERPGARLFDAQVEPVTLARRIERVIDEERRAGPEGPVAPTRFRLALHPRDLAALGRTGTPAEDLAAAALEHARRRGYRIPERPTVELTADPNASHGTVHVAAGFAEAAFASSARMPARREHTMVHPAARPDMPMALLRVVEADGRERRVPLDARTIAIGRSRDNDVPLDDPMASRHHARIVPRSGRFLLSDLGSMNGTLVNGRPVREAILGIGDRIDIGGTRLEVLPPEWQSAAAAPAAPDMPAEPWPAPEPWPASDMPAEPWPAPDPWPAGQPWSPPEPWAAPEPGGGAAAVDELGEAAQRGADAGGWPSPDPWGPEPAAPAPWPPVGAMPGDAGPSAGGEPATELAPDETAAGLPPPAGMATSGLDRGGSAATPKGWWQEDLGPEDEWTA